LPLIAHCRIGGTITQATDAQVGAITGAYERVRSRALRPQLSTSNTADRAGEDGHPDKDVNASWL
jgi:hypothetical protein